MKRIHLVPLLMAVGLAACGHKEEAAPGPTAGVETEVAAKRTLEQTVTGYGQVEFMPARSASLVVQVESQVVAVLSAPGAAVRAGDPLVRLRPSAQTALDVGRATREAALAAGAARRLQRLRDEGLATEAEAGAAMLQAETSAQLRDSLSARTGGGEYLLRAPRAGIVDLLAVQPGDLLPAATTIARLGDSAGLQARIGLEPDDAARVVAGAVARVSRPQSEASPVVGRVSSIERRIDKESRLAAACVALPPSAALMAGLQVVGRVVVARHEGVAVPVAALLHEGEALAIYVVSGGKAHRRVVRAGIDDGEYVEILDGLTAGTEVVTTGNHELGEGMAVRVIGAAQGQAR